MAIFIHSFKKCFFASFGCTRGEKNSIKIGFAWETKSLANSNITSTSDEEKFLNCLSPLLDVRIPRSEIASAHPVPSRHLVSDTKTIEIPSLPCRCSALDRAFEQPPVDGRPHQPEGVPRPAARNLVRVRVTSLHPPEIHRPCPSHPSAESKTVAARKRSQTRSAST